MCPNLAEYFLLLVVFLFYRLGESVVIPPGQNILLDVSPPKLQLIILEGTLQFEDAKDIHLQASYIFVRGGHLIIGTEDSPYNNKVDPLDPSLILMLPEGLLNHLKVFSFVSKRQLSLCMATQTQKRSCHCMVQRISLSGTELLTCMGSQRNPHGHC